MYFELARMFPIYKPTDIPELPLSYYLEMVAYYNEVRGALATPPPRESFLNDEALTDVDFDEMYQVGRG